MSDAEFTIIVHYEDGRRPSRQDFHTRKAARLYAKRIAGATGVTRIMLSSPNDDVELWSKDDVSGAVGPMSAVAFRSTARA